MPRSTGKPARSTVRTPRSRCRKVARAPLRDVPLSIGVRWSSGRLALEDDGNIAASAAAIDRRRLAQYDKIYEPPNTTARNHSPRNTSGCQTLDFLLGALRLTCWRMRIGRFTHNHRSPAADGK
jgi:hypothetical protein